jgi:acyl transferase domain-containing protein
MLAALGEWVAEGGPLDWNGVFPAGGRRVDLPTVAWQRRRYWVEAEVSDRAAAFRDGDETAIQRLAEDDGLSDVARGAIPEIVEALRANRVASAAERTVARWFYSLDWCSTKAEALLGSLTGVWAILGTPETGGLLAAALTRSGATPHVTSDVAELGRLIESATELRGVIHEPGFGRGCEDRVLQVAQLLASRSSEAARGWWMTRGAVVTGSRDRASVPDQALIWGFARSFALEHPGAWGGIVDVPSTHFDDEMASRVVAVLAGGHKEDQLALRPDGLFAPRLVSRAPADWTQWRISPRGTALVTGGLGGLGLHVARWLARQGKEHLLLLGRRGLATPGAPEAVAELEALG